MYKFKLREGCHYNVNQLKYSLTVKSDMNVEINRVGGQNDGELFVSKQAERLMGKKREREEMHETKNIQSVREAVCKKNI